MTRGRSDGLILFVLGSLMFILTGAFCERIAPASMLDFKGLYYSARCLLQHSDPYRQSDLARIYQSEAPDWSVTDPDLRKVVTLWVNLPPVFIVTAPVAMLPWGVAHHLWFVLIAASFILAAFLMWKLGSDYAPVISGGLIGIFLVGSELLIEVGNLAGMVVSLCIVGVWCFVEEKFVPAGVVCFALSLVLKPHVAGFVLLYFLLGGARYRKRAWQALGLATLLCVPGTLWVWHVAPHFFEEMRMNLRTISLHGGLNDPGPAGFVAGFHGAVTVSLQTVVSVFRDDPHFYNLFTYLFCAPFLLAWAITVLRKGISREGTWLALASIAALSMLPLYHRMHDVGLLLLIFPGFAMLWAKGGPTRWLALVVTSVSTLMANDFTVQALAISSTHLRESTSGLLGQVLTVVLVRPVPLVLLAVGTFYLCAYMRHKPQLQAASSVNQRIKCVSA